MGVGYRVDHGRRDSFLEGRWQERIAKTNMVSLKDPCIWKSFPLPFPQDICGHWPRPSPSRFAKRPSRGGRQHDRIGKDVSQFLPQPLTVNPFGIPVLFPEKQFIQFGRLYGKSQRQVLGVMELFNPARHGTERADRATP